jgi:hypothetical protein
MFDKKGILDLDVDLNRYDQKALDTLCIVSFQSFPSEVCTGLGPWYCEHVCICIIPFYNDNINDCI